MMSAVCNVNSSFNFMVECFFFISVLFCGTEWDTKFGFLTYGTPILQVWALC